MRVSLGLRILFVDTAVDFSIADSARGYRDAMKQAGHDIHTFRTAARMAFVHGALKHGPAPEMASDASLVSATASEMMVVEALKHRADLVVIVSGLGLHPNGLELLSRAGFPIVLILTESPYEDANQVGYARHCAYVFTNDSHSLVAHPDWHYLPSAYDPAYHHPFPAEPAEAVDVLFIGTGWPERQQLLEGVNWDGINLRIMGAFPGVTSDSPLWPHFTNCQVTNDEAARLYSSAKITINHHRYHPDAYSLNPRGYELGGCGAFQLSDMRPEIRDVYGDSVSTYADGHDLETLIVHYLEHDAERRTEAEYQRFRLLRGHHTFDDRWRHVMAVVSQS